MDSAREHYSHLVGDSFLVGKAGWALRGCMTTEGADYCMLVNESAWLSLLVKAGSGFGFSFGVRAWTEMEC